MEKPAYFVNKCMFYNIDFDKMKSISGMQSV